VTSIQRQEESPVSNPEPTHQSLTAQVTKYSSEIGQTDDTPFITANGDTVGPGTLACPGRYPFGTKVIINGAEYRCNDRMNIRYRDGNYFDIWTHSTAEAYAWGRKTVEVKVYD